MLFVCYFYYQIQLILIILNNYLNKDLTRDQFVKYYKNIISKNYSGNPDQFCHLAFNGILHSTKFFRFYFFKLFQFYYYFKIAFDLNDSNHIDFSEMIVGLTVLTSGTKGKQKLLMHSYN